MRALPPNDAIAAATFFSSFSLRASKRSSPAPANAISLAIAAPTPLDAPVTRTVLPLISMRVLPGSFPLRPNGSWLTADFETLLANLSGLRRSARDYDRLMFEDFSQAVLLLTL